MEQAPSHTCIACDMQFHQSQKIFCNTYHKLIADSSVKIILDIIWDLYNSEFIGLLCLVSIYRYDDLLDAEIISTPPSTKYITSSGFSMVVKAYTEASVNLFYIH